MDDELLVCARKPAKDFMALTLESKAANPIGSEAFLNKIEIRAFLLKNCPVSAYCLRYLLSCPIRVSNLPSYKVGFCVDPDTL